MALVTIDLTQLEAETLRVSLEKLLVSFGTDDLDSLAEGGDTLSPQLMEARREAIEELIQRFMAVERLVYLRDTIGQLESVLTRDGRTTSFPVIDESMT